MSVLVGLPAADIAESGLAIAEVMQGFVGARVLITGASGFIGRWLVAGLLASGCPIELVLLGRDDERLRRVVPPGHESKVHIHIGDLLIPESVKDLPPCTHVIHAASGTRRDGDPWHELADLDDADFGVINLLRACEHMPLRRVLLISSGIVVTPLASNQPGIGYSIGKRVAEARLILSARTRGFSTVVARVWSLIGPGLPANRGYAAADFVAAAAVRSAIRIAGDGSAVRSYQYPSDTAVWLWSLLARGHDGVIYDVGGAAPVTILELAKHLDRLAGGAGVVVGGMLGQGGVYVPDLTVAHALGLSNRVDLTMALERSLRWARAESKL